jgi:predicted nucleotidyltransferase
MSPQEGLGGLPLTAISSIRQCLASFPGIECVWLYGSRAKGTQREGSDLDLALQGEALTHRTRLLVMEALDELELPYPIDVTLLAGLPPEVVAHIQRVGIRLFEK